MQTSKLTTILENEHKKQDTPYGLFSPIWNNNRYFKMDYMYSRYKWRDEFHSFLQAFLLIIALLLFVIWDIVLHKITLRVISTIILLCFNIWSYTYYFKIEELKEYWDGVRYSPNDAYLPPNIDNFIFVWLANQVLVLYLLLAIGISHLLQRKKTLAKHDNI